MKKANVILLVITVLLSCNQTTTSGTNSTGKSTEEIKEAVPVTSTANTDTTFSFNSCELNKIPKNWSQYATGRGDNTDWKIVDDNGGKVLAQLSNDNPNYHFNEIVFDGFTVKNVDLEVKLKGVDGKKDQGGGFVWRFIDANNYYVVRANPLEDNVVLYKVKNGKRSDLALVGKGRTYGVDVKPLGDGWNTLKLTVKDDLFTVFLNNEQIFQVKDETFTKAGKIGLWTKADAVTYFDDFRVTSLK